MTPQQRGRAAGLFGIVALASALFTWVLITARFTDPAVWVQVACGVAGLTYYLLTNMGNLGGQFSGRGTFFTVFSFATTAVLILALAGVNWLAVKKPKTWDLTKDKIFTLSEQTESLVKGLRQEVKVTAFYVAADPEFLELQSRLRQYRGLSDKLVVEFLDPAKHLREVKELNVTRTGPRIIVRAGAKEARAKEVTEEALTNAIAEVTRGAAKKIYFTKGHGERSLADATERGFKLYGDGLRSEGFQLEDLPLPTLKEIPTDASALVLAGPRSALGPAEAQIVQAWVDKGGKLLALVDPGVVTGLEKAFQGWGIQLGNDEVIDADSEKPEWAIAQEYTEHPVTTPRGATVQFTVFPLARSVQPLKGAQGGWTSLDLARTGARSWGEVDPITDGRVRFDEGRDLKGPVPLAVAATHGAGEAESRVVVVGNSAFAANATLTLLGNRDFALNAASWVAHDESKLSIRPKTRAANQLFLSTAQKDRMTLFAFDLLPFSLLFAGLFVWQSRKSR